MTDELPDLAEWEAKLDEQTARLDTHGKRMRQGKELIGLTPFILPAAMLVIAFLIT